MMTVLYILYLPLITSALAYGFFSFLRLGLWVTLLGIVVPGALIYGAYVGKLDLNKIENKFIDLIFRCCVIACGVGMIFGYLLSYLTKYLS